MEISTLEITAQDQPPSAVITGLTSLMAWSLLGALTFTVSV